MKEFIKKIPKKSIFLLIITILITLIGYNGGYEIIQKKFINNNSKTSVEQNERNQLNSCNEDTKKIVYNTVNYLELKYEISEENKIKLITDNSNMFLDSNDDNSNVQGSSLENLMYINCSYFNKEKSSIIAMTSLELIHTVSHEFYHILSFKLNDKIIKDKSFLWLLTNNRTDDGYKKWNLIIKEKNNDEKVWKDTSDRVDSITTDDSFVSKKYKTNNEEHQADLFGNYIVSSDFGKKVFSFYLNKLLLNEQLKKCDSTHKLSNALFCNSISDLVIGKISNQLESDITNKMKDTDNFDFNRFVNTDGNYKISDEGKTLFDSFGIFIKQNLSNTLTRENQIVFSLY